MGRCLILVFGALILALVGCGGGGGGPSGDANKGKQLFESKQCVTCHTLTGITTATGTIGPSLNGIGTAAATRKPGVAAEAYIRESIKDPNAFTAPGYTPGLMVLPIPVNDQEITDLVAFLLTQK